MPGSSLGPRLEGERAGFGTFSHAIPVRLRVQRVKRCLIVFASAWLLFTRVHTQRVRLELMFPFHDVESELCHAPCCMLLNTSQMDAAERGRTTANLCHTDQKCMIPPVDELGGAVGAITKK